MKKIILLVLIMLITIPLVSAADWDNMFDYSENDLKVTISNTFLLLFPTSEIGTAELKSHPSINYVKKVGAGNQVVMWYDFNFVELYLNGLGEVEFTDMRIGEEIDRDYSFVYWGEKEKDIYGCEYSFSANGTKVCNSVVIGKETHETWLPYNSKDIPKGNIRIGLMTYVEVDDKVDGVWTIAGKKVKKHAEWTAELNVGIVSYFKLEEDAASTAVDDAHASNNGTASTNTNDLSVVGKIDDGFEFVAASTEYVNIDLVGTALATATTGTWSAWIKPVDATPAGVEEIISFGDNDATTFVLLSLLTNGKLRAQLTGAATNYWQVDTDAAPFTAGVWSHIALVHNGTTPILYADGVAVAQTFVITTDKTKWFNDLPGLDNGNLARLYFDGSGIQYFNGVIDEVGLWNRTLTPAEITQLYNGGAGITYETVLEITLLSPEDNANFTTNIINFSANVSDPFSLGIQNVSLVIDGTINQTNTSGIEGSYNWTSISFVDGNHNWTVIAYDDGDGLVGTTTRSFNVNTTPFIQFENPTPTNYYNSTSSYVSVNVSLTETYFENITFSFYNNTLTEFYYEDSTRFINESLIDGTYSYNVTVWTTTDQTNSTETRNITIDTTDPLVNIIYPTNITYTDNYGSANNVTIQLNWSSIDPHLDACWYYNTTANVTLTCGDNATIYLPYGSYTFFVYANDTFGHLSSDNITATWAYNFLEGVSTFTPFAFETKNYSFAINVSSTQTISSLSAFLNYNGTIHSTDSSCAVGDCEIFTTIDIPLTTGGVDNENKSFFWQLSIFNGTGTSKVNTSTQSQNISAINFSECGTLPIGVNFTTHKEIDRAALNTNFNAYFQYYLGTGDVYKEGNSSQTGASVYDFCINQNETFFVTSSIGLSATSFDDRHYDLIKKEYTNTTTIQPLYLLNSTISSIIIIEVKDQGLIPKKDIIVNISRFYLGIGQYVIIETQITDEFGQITAKLIENDAKYKFAFYDLNNNLLKTSEGITIACRSVYCVIPFVIEDVVEEFERFENLTTYSYTFSFDNTTNMFVFSWDDQRGESTTTRLEVTRYLLNGSSIVCDTSSTSILSTLTCGVGDSRASYKAQVFRSAGGERKRISLLNIKVADPASTFGVEGLLWVFILLFTCMGIGAFNPSVGAGLYGAGFVIMGILGVISMPVPVFFANTLLVILFIWAVNK